MENFIQWTNTTHSIHYCTQWMIYIYIFLQRNPNLFLESGVGKRLYSHVRGHLFNISIHLKKGQKRPLNYKIECRFINKFTLTKLLYLAKWSIRWIKIFVYKHWRLYMRSINHMIWDFVSKISGRCKGINITFNLTIFPPSNSSHWGSWGSRICRLMPSWRKMVTILRNSA